MSVVSQAHSALSDKVVSISAQVVSVDGRATSLANAVSVVSQQVSVLSQQVSVLSQAQSALSDKVVSISAQVVSVESHAVAASAAATSVDGRATSLAQAISVISQSLSTVVSGASARSVGNVSTHGFQSILNALSNRISAGAAGSVTSAEVQTASAAATSVDARATSLAQAISVLSQSLSTIVSGVSGRSAGNVSTHGIQSIVNALSNRISAIPGAGSANPRTRCLSAAATVSAATMANVTGFSLLVSAGGVYQLEVAILINNSSAGQRANVGMTFPSMTQARGTAKFHSRTGQVYTSAAISNFPHAIIWEGNSASGSILVSSLSGNVASMLASIDGVFDVGTGGVVQIQAGTSASAGAQVVILAGSYMKLYRVN